MINVIYELDKRANGFFSFHCPYCDAKLNGYKFAPDRCKFCNTMLPIIDDLAIKLKERLHYYEYGMRKGLFLG